MSPPLEIRRAHPGDTLRMWQITRDVWGGNDYLPSVWEEWLGDAGGILMVATHEGKLLGLQHIDAQPDGVAWIEGIRVDPDAQGLGVGSRLLLAGLEWARSAGYHTARLCTSSENPASNRMALKAGMTQLGAYPTLRAGTLEQGMALDGIRVAGVTDYEQVTHLLAMRQPADQNTWIYTEGWTARTLTTDRLRLLLAANSVVVAWSSGLDAVGIATYTATRSFLRLGLLAGTPSDSERIARWLRFRARQVGLTGVRATITGDHTTQRALSSAGFSSPDGHAMLLYEFVLRAQSASARSVLQNASSSQGSVSG